MIDRRSPRLRTWDYATPAAYFVTVVTRQRKAVFGHIDEQGRMNRSTLGSIAQTEWRRTTARFPNSESPAFVVMPNHVHGIVYVNLNPDPDSRPVNLSTFIGSYKSAVSRQAAEALWQRSFYDRIIRDERDLATLWDYIESNPARWAEDRENRHGVHSRAGQAPPLRPVGDSPAVVLAPTARIR